MTDTQNTITWSPKVVWPPNHKMVPITIAWTESGEGGVDQNTLKVTDITSSGLDSKGSGSGQPSPPQGPDYTGVGNSDTAADGSPATVTVYVRAERPGTDMAGRTYTISLSCQSSSDTMGMAKAIVTVPHDMGNNTTSTSSTTSSSAVRTSLLGRLP
jgi:hypothetical protein